MREESNRQYKKRKNTIKQRVEEMEQNIEQIKCTLRPLEKSVLFYKEVFTDNS